MTIRIALTLAGGVSLGAYQGGVAYELLWALSHRTNPAEPVFVDVLTGASAGSMTAGLLARTLLYDRGSASDLHRAWVSGISFELLMKGNRRSSFLSDEPIWGLARQVLRPPPQPRNPHPAAPHELWMAFTLSNLNGVNFGLGYAGAPGRFDTTVFSDWVIFKLLRLLATTPEEDNETWRRIATAAIASGAFPFAFPTVNVERHLSDYVGSDVYQAEGSRNFTYIDGGLFNNEPVGLARDIVGQMELTYPEVYGDTRLYILVDPYVAGSSSVAEFPETPLGYQLVLNRAMSAILGEASKRDWIRAERANTRIQWQDTLLTYLAELIVRVAGTDREYLARKAEQLAYNIAEQKVSYQSGGAAAGRRSSQKTS